MGAVWLGAFLPPVHKKPWLWAVLAGGAILFGPTIAFIQVPLQTWAKQALLHFWDKATLDQHLLLSGIPALLFTGFVQEGLKLVPAIIYMKYSQPLFDRDAISLGAVAGAGFGIFEAAWIFNTIFASGFTWATVQFQGLQALIPFWERFSALAFHTATTALAIYGWNKGKGWQFYFLVALLHILLNYSAILFSAQVLTLIQVEIYVSVLAALILIPCLWLRWRKSGKESDMQSVPSGSTQM